MNIEETNNFLKKLNHGLFATKPNTKEALEFAYSLIETLGPEERAAAYTALHVTVNTIANDVLNDLKKLINKKD